MKISAEFTSFFTQIMARAYDPGGHLPPNNGNYGTFKYGPNPGGDLEIFDCFPGPVLTV